MSPTLVSVPAWAEGMDPLPDTSQSISRERFYLVYLVFKASPLPHSHSSLSSGSLVNLIVLLMKICNSSNINYQQQQQLWNKSSLFLIIRFTLSPATAQFSFA